MAAKPIKIEYLWFDGYTPEPNLRSKTKIIRVDVEQTQVTLESVPMWSLMGHQQNRPKVVALIVY